VPFLPAPPLLLLSSYASPLLAVGAAPSVLRLTVLVFTAEGAIRRQEEAVWQADGRQRWLRESGQVATRPPAIDEAQPERAAFHRYPLPRL